MALSYNLGYQETISVHPTRRQNFAGKPYSTLPNIWEWLISSKKSFDPMLCYADICLSNFCAIFLCTMCPICLSALCPWQFCQWLRPNGKPELDINANWAKCGRRCGWKLGQGSFISWDVQTTTNSKPKMAKVHRPLSGLFNSLWHLLQTWP